MNGERLRKMRRLSGLSQYRLALLAGNHRDRISRAECGYLVLEQGELEKIRSVLEAASIEHARELESLARATQ